jgi:MATE family multidrug resistance protein
MQDARQAFRPALIQELPPLLRLAGPLIAGELGWVAMSLVDTIMLGHLPNAALAMSAASIAQVLFNVFCFGVGGTLLGLDSLISQALGAKEQTEANRWLMHGLVLAAALSAILIAVFAFSPALLRFLPMDPAVTRAAIPAMTGLNYGTLPLLVYFTLRRYLQAAHHGLPIAYALISANLVNAAADWLLIYGHRWKFAGHTVAIPAFGVTGSSWATSFARLYLAVFLAIALWMIDRRHGYGLRRVSRRIEFAHMKRLLQLGAPAGASIFVEIAIFALVTAICATFGPLQLAGHEVALQCASTTFMVPYAISAATAVRVGHAIGRMRSGAGTAASAIAAGWAGIGCGAAFMLLSAVAFLLIPQQIARLFTPDSGVLRAAVPLLAISAGFQFFDGVQINAAGALRGAGHTTAPFIIQIICYWGVAMPLGLVLAFHAHMAAAGLWWGLLIALTASAIMLSWQWRHVTLSFQQKPASIS